MHLFLSPLKKWAGIFFLFSGLLFISCGDSFGTDNSFNPEGPFLINQKQINNFSLEYPTFLNKIDQRYQVSDLQVSKGSCDIRFQDGKFFSFPRSIFPIIQLDGSRNWSISGYTTDLEIRTNDEGELLYPSIIIGKDGFWALDSLHTDFSAKSYQDFIKKSGSKSLNVTGLLIYEDVLYVYLSNASVYKYPVIRDSFYQVPEYWRNHLVEKERMAESAIAEADEDYAAFVFFTDAHWEKNMRKSPALIRHIIDFTPFSDVVFGGDVITNYYAEIDKALILGESFQAAFGFLGTNFHCLYGNHDDNSPGHANNPSLYLSEEQVYSWLQSQMTDVHYGGYYNFYYDKLDSRTRIICLDTGRYNAAKSRDKLPNTVAFAIEALSSVPEGWHIIIASHIWSKSNKQSDGTYKQSIESYIKPILKVFDDYNARMAGYYAFNKQYVPYDFSKARGTIEFCIGGHTHGDFTTYSDGGIPIIVVISDYVGNPQKGTTQEQSVTMTVVDYKNKKLRLFVVGRGSDREIEL